MEFIWKEKKSENSTLCNDYEYGGLKNADIFSKVVSLLLDKKVIRLQFSSMEINSTFIQI